MTAWVCCFPNVLFPSFDCCGYSHILLMSMFAGNSWRFISQRWTSSCHSTPRPRQTPEWWERVWMSEHTHTRAHTHNKDDLKMIWKSLMENCHKTHWSWNQELHNVSSGEETSPSKETNSASFTLYAWSNPSSFHLYWCNQVHRLPLRITSTLSAEVTGAPHRLHQNTVCSLN